MKILGIIPARYASTRFPGKPLIDINGKPMIQLVYDQAKKCKMLAAVVVATDDNRIETAVKNFNGEVVMTSEKHESGTDRCYEAMIKSGNKFDAVINIQGDEPFIDPEQIESVATRLQDKNVQLCTLVKKLNNKQELIDPNIVKVIVNAKKEAVYFSRTAIPYYRGKDLSEGLKLHIYYKHIGIYGYRSDVLAEITKLDRTPLEIAESLEQLRWIESGYKIAVDLTTNESHAVDTPADLEMLIKKFS